MAEVSLVNTERSGSTGIGGTELSTNLKGTEIDVNRNSSDYRFVIDELKSNRIGKPKGNPDRAIIADTLFAKSSDGSVPKFVTGDIDIFTRLAENYASTEFTTAQGTLPGGTKKADIIKEMLRISGQDYFKIDIPSNSTGTKRSLHIYPII